MDGWIAVDGIVPCTYKLLSGSISVSASACSRSICVTVWTKSLHFISFRNIEEEMSLKQLNQGQSHLSILNLRMWEGLCLKALMSHLLGFCFNKALNKLSNQHCFLCGP